VSNPSETFDPSGPETPSFRVPPEMPVLPLRDTVLFPQAFMPLAVARESSVKLIDEAVASGQTIAVFAQKEAGEDEPFVSRVGADASEGETASVGREFVFPLGAEAVVATADGSSDSSSSRMLSTSTVPPAANLPA